jgi:hypothetical protein
MQGSVLLIRQPHPACDFSDWPAFEHPLSNNHRWHPVRDRFDQKSTNLGSPRQILAAKREGSLQQHEPFVHHRGCIEARDHGTRRIQGPDDFVEHLAQNLKPFAERRGDTFGHVAARLSAGRAGHGIKGAGGRHSRTNFQFHHYANCTGRRCTGRAVDRNRILDGQISGGGAMLRRSNHGCPC